MVVVDGVQVHHVDSDDEVSTAHLVFGVGWRDEELREQGVLHALEHVVMSQLRTTPLDINAHVDSSHTEFDVSGSPALVADYLTRLCRCVNDPPVDRLPAEAPIIAAEIGGEAGVHQPLLARRYGLRDLGSHALPGPGPDGLDGAQLQRVAERWFTAGNAFLLVDGPLPPGLSLPLRPGARPQHTRISPRPVDGPRAIRLDGPACAASMLLPPPDPDHLDEVTAEPVEQRVAETVRHRDGLSYVVETNVFDDVAHPKGRGGQDLLVHTEPPDEQVARAVTVLVTELRSLLNEGPSETELARALDRVVERRHGRAAALEQVRTAGIDALLGLHRPRFEVGRMRALTPQQVKAYLEPLEATLLIAVPDDPEVDLAVLRLRETAVAPTTRDDLPDGRRYRAPLLARALSSAARQAELCLTSEGLHARLEGETQSIGWSSVVGVLVEDEHEAVVFGADASAIQIGSTTWREGDSLLQAARDHISPGLFFQRSALLDTPDEGD